MDVSLQKSAVIGKPEINISGSKSETNRLLLLQALHPGIDLKNSSDSDDSRLMSAALSSTGEVIDIGHAGTAMRFLTAYFAIKSGRSVMLTGSERMKQRPIKILVDALRSLGADIRYVEKEGYPPLKIVGKNLSGQKVSIESEVSSQYISALLLIAASLENGLQIELQGKPASLPYIDLTLALLSDVGITALSENNRIIVPPALSKLAGRTIIIESDWSSASYFYSIVALSDIGTQLQLSTFNPNSRQGDSKLAYIYEAFGVETEFISGSVKLTKKHFEPHFINLDLSDTPDLAQTIAVTCLGLGLGCELSGLSTLPIKETDRLSALRNELQNLGATVATTASSLTMQAAAQIISNVAINTYDDHRMAMAFAPLAIKVPLVIKDSKVVSKSYPAYWDDLRKIGFEFV